MLLLLNLHAGLMYLCVQGLSKFLGVHLSFSEFTLEQGYEKNAKEVAWGKLSTYIGCEPATVGSNRMMILGGK